MTENMLRLAVAAVLEADKEFRANMPPEWDGDPLSSELDGLRRIFEATPPPLNHVMGSEPTHRHKKRGSTYTLIGIGKMQAENWEEREYCATDDPTPGVSVDMREVAIYRSTDDGSLWVRPREEFEDGRFEAFSASEVHR